MDCERYLDIKVLFCELGCVCNVRRGYFFFFMVREGGGISSDIFCFFAIFFCIFVGG